MSMHKQTRYQKEMTGLNSQRITEHERVTENVTVTTYQDGTKVYVNYGNEIWRNDDFEVPARDYCVERGMGK